MKDSTKNKWKNQCGDTAQWLFGLQTWEWEFRPLTTQVNAGWACGPLVNPVWEVRDKEFPEQAGCKTSHIREFWIWLRDPASTSKMEKQQVSVSTSLLHTYVYKSAVMSTHTYIYTCKPHTWKKKEELAPGEHIWGCPVASTSMCMHAYMHTCAHTHMLTNSREGQLLWPSFPAQQLPSVSPGRYRPWW